MNLDRINSELFHKNKTRIIATACWSFPIYSQTFVYQELTELMKKGFELRFLYSKQDSRKLLPRRFSRLWHSRRRLILNRAVNKRDYKHYRKRMPEKIDELVKLISEASGLSQKDVRDHQHFLQAFSFTRMVENYRPHYLHSYFFYESTLFTFFASYLLGIPRGVSCYADHMLQDYDLKLVPTHLEQCCLVIATSNQIKKELMSIAPTANPNIILVKPNAIDASQFEIKHRNMRKNKDPFRIVSVSRIEPKKGLLFLADALSQLKQTGVNVEWRLIGSTDESQASKDYFFKLQEKITQLGLQEIIHLEGRRSAPEIKRFFQTADLFVAPFIETESGDKDGIPTSLLEAMAAELPVVATDAGSIAEAIESGKEGILVPQKNSSALASAIAQLVADPVERKCLGLRAGQRLRKHFDVSVCEETFHRRILKLLKYSSILNREKSPLVSVIIIFFNAERFFREAIESVFAQTYKPWELLLVDDGSSDSSPETARFYAENNPERVRYLHHPEHANRGMSASRNLGIQNATGEYVAFLDADDVWLPNKLERQVAIMEFEPEATMIYGATKYWRSWNPVPEDSGVDYIPDLGVEPETIFNPPALSTLLYPLGNGSSPCPSDFLMRRKQMVDIGGFEEHFRGIYQMYEDMAFLAKVYLEYSVFVSGECWDKYRIHHDSCLSTVSRNGHYHDVRKYFLNWLDSYLSGRQITSGVVWETLQYELRKYKVQQETVASSNGFNWGDLRRLTPFSKWWGYDRGRPIDRYYIENFLKNHSSDIRGRTLEIEDDQYTSFFGSEKTTRRDVLHVKEGNPKATIVADLTQADQIPSNTFDCIVLTQTLQLIFDTRAALRTLHRILKPSGVLLATFPGITRISQNDWPGYWCWSFTSNSAQRLFNEFFSSGNLEVKAYGNILATTSFLYGLAMEELRSDELDYCDPDFELLITVRAVKE